LLSQRNMHILFAWMYTPTFMKWFDDIFTQMLD
jgi:hypothetical protein